MRKKLILLFMLSLVVYGNEKVGKNVENIKNMGNIENIEKRSEKRVETLIKTGDIELVDGLDSSYRLEDDFYKYVNNKWLEKTELPATKPAWGVFTELSEENQEYLKNLVKNLKEKGKWDKNSEENKLLVLHDSYYNVERRNSEGLNPIKKELEKVNKIKNIKDFVKYSEDSTKEGEGGVLYGWGVSGDINDSKNNTIYLGYAGIGLSREYYQKETKENNEILEKYTEYVADVLNYIGEENTVEKAKNIVEFEKEIAKLLLTNEERYDVKKYNNPRTTEQLKEIVKSVDLNKYLEKVGVNTNKVLITEIKYYENLDKLLKEENIETIKDYMKFHMVVDASNVLTDELGQKKFDFYGKYLVGQKERETLEKRALYFINGNMGEVISKIYIKDKFSEDAKKDTKEMVDYIIKAFRGRVEKLEWMSENTKKKALEKLDKFNVKIGYPDKWEDLSTLEINEKDSLYTQMEKINKWVYNKKLEKVGKEVDKLEWFMNAHDVNAYYAPNKNEIVFPAGILQYPFYSYEKSGVGSNFGGIGAVIAHELTHGFDVSGANYDGDGNVNDWWTKEDKEQFEKVTKKLEDEFSTYSVADGININGKFTLTENIADLGGVNISYDGLQLYLKDHPEKNIDVNGYTQDQLFFLNYGRIWRKKSSQEYLNNQVKTDSHSPAYFRVNGTLKNVDAFHKIFNTKEGDKLYKKEEDRIKIW